MAEKRKRVWVDRFQTYLSFRIALYFVLYQAAVWALVLTEWQMLGTLTAVLGPGAVASWSVFLVGVVGVIGVLFIRDAVVFSHRAVGPLHRFRRALRAITEGEEVAPLVLRKGDFLQEMADEFNEMLRTLERRGAVALKPAPAKEQKGQPQPV